MKFDTATTEFMDKVADQPDQHSPGLARESTLAVAKKLVRAIHDPATVLPKMIIGASTKEMLKEGGMPPLQILGVLNEHYDRDWWDWEPETIWTTLEKEQGIHADTELKNMLMAFQVINSTNAPFEHWHIFEKVSHALNANPVEFQILQPLEMDEIALTMKVLKAMRPGAGFEQEIYAYTAAAAKEAGLAYLPSELFGENSQPFLDQMDHSALVKNEVAKLWPSYSSKNPPADPTIAHQLAMLDEISNYVEKNV